MKFENFSGFILYMNGIDAIQRNNIFRVNPINLFENRSKNDEFKSGLFEQQTNKNFNLNHPKVAGSETQARNLDFLA